MVIDMNEAGLTGLEQLRSFLEGTRAVAFRPLQEDDKRYAHISAVLRRFGYARLRRADKGLVRRYLRRTTGYSRAQLNRLVGRVAAGQPLGKRYRAPASGFARIYTEADIALLAEIDTLHGTLSGP